MFFFKQKTGYGMRISDWSSDVCSSDLGTVTACEPPKSFALTWEFGGGISWVEVELAEAGDDSTRLTLRHIAPLDDKSEEFWDRFGPAAAGVGWDLPLLVLGWPIATGATTICFAAEPLPPQLR